MLGEAFLVAPILEAGGARDVALPAGANWYDWWDEDAIPLDGGQTLPVDVAAWSRVPLYVREGAIVPLQDATEVTGLGTTASRSANTVLVYPGAVPSEFTIHEADDSAWQITVTPGPSSLTITLTRNPVPVYLRLCWNDGIQTIRLGGEPLDVISSRTALDQVDSGFAQATGEPWLWIKLPESTTPLELSLE
jgi:alpha-D-xyloside xylohydrolase